MLEELKVSGLLACSLKSSWFSIAVLIWMLIENYFISICRDRCLCTDLNKMLFIFPHIKGVFWQLLGKVSPERTPKRVLFTVKSPSPGTILFQKTRQSKSIYVCLHNVYLLKQMISIFLNRVDITYLCLIPQPRKSIFLFNLS